MKSVISSIKRMIGKSIGNKNEKSNDGYPFREEYVRINGISEYLLHYPTAPDAPVILQIHGGPGAPESVFAYLVEAFERRYTIVYYDQRGAGKTLKKNPFAKVSMELLLQDLVETVSYLKHVYNKKKIMILGHSWGSVLGSAYALAHPENVSCYIGCGQMYCFRENEKRAYSFLKTAIRKNRNRSAWNQLKRIGPYPPDRCSLKALTQVTRIRALQGKLGLAMEMNRKAVQLMLRSPVCGLTDVLAFVLGGVRSAVMMREFWNDDLRREGHVYRIPVFYVMGDRDRTTPYEIARDFFDRMEAPYKEWCFVPDAGHFAMLDNTESWQRILNEVVIKDINSNRTVSGIMKRNPGSL